MRGGRIRPSEGNGEERGKFWNDLDRIMDRVGSGYRLCFLGDLNGWIGDRARAGITGENEKESGGVLC